MPTDGHYRLFGIVTATVCVPFLILIGSLNTTGGMHFWRHQCARAFAAIGRWLAWGFRFGRQREAQNRVAEDDLDFNDGLLRMSRSTSLPNTQDMRLRRMSTIQNGSLAKEGVEVHSAEGKEPESIHPDGLRSPTPRLADMWFDERQRTLRYSPSV